MLIEREPSSALSRIVEEPDEFAVDQSMFIEVDDSVLEHHEKIKRYSVIGNDPSFKSYTKNHAFYDVPLVTEPENVKQSVLEVSLKDLEDSKEQFKRIKNTDLVESLQREQYRIIKKDLLFVVKFASISSSRYLGSKEAVSERTFNDFFKLGQALQKQFPGCFVPIIVKQQASIDLPQQIFEFRKTPMEFAQVDNFCRKLRSCNYLLDSDAVQLFMDPRIFQVQLDAQLSKLVKLTTTSGDALNRFKQCFNQLSGKEIDQTTFEKIEKFKGFLVEQNKLIMRFKSIVEKALTKKVEFDNAKTKCFEALADLEELLSSESTVH